MLPASGQTPFTPSPQQAHTLLHQLADPSYTLADLAEEHGTTLPALTRWAAQPEIAAQLDAIERCFARRTRLMAAGALPATVEALQHVVGEYVHEATNVPVNPRSPAAHEQRRRSRETARKAAALLLRLARFTPGPAPTPPTPPSRPPRPTGGDDDARSHPALPDARAQNAPDDRDDLPDLLRDLAALGIRIPVPATSPAPTTATPDAPPTTTRRILIDPADAPTTAEDTHPDAPAPTSASADTDTDVETDADITPPTITPTSETRTPPTPPPPSLQSRGRAPRRRPAPPPSHNTPAAPQSQGPAPPGHPPRPPPAP